MKQDSRSAASRHVDVPKLMLWQKNKHLVISLCVLREKNKKDLTFWYSLLHPASGPYTSQQGLGTTSRPCHSLSWAKTRPTPERKTETRSVTALPRHTAFFRSCFSKELHLNVTCWDSSNPFLWSWLRTFWKKPGMRPLSLVCSKTQKPECPECPDGGAS